MGYVVAMETESPRPDCTRCKELEKQVAELAAEVKRLAKKLEFKTRVVRRCFLLGNDPVTGKNYDHRKVWIQQQLQRPDRNMKCPICDQTMEAGEVQLRKSLINAMTFGWGATDLLNYWAPILERVGLSGELWCDLIKRFGKIFKRVAGTPESLAQEAILRGQSGYRTGGSPLPA